MGFQDPALWEERVRGPLGCWGQLKWLKVQSAARICLRTAESRSSLSSLLPLKMGCLAEMAGTRAAVQGIALPHLVAMVTLLGCQAGQSKIGGCGYCQMEMKLTDGEGVGGETSHQAEAAL